MPNEITVEKTPERIESERQLAEMLKEAEEDIKNGRFYTLEECMVLLREELVRTDDGQRNKAV